MTKTQTTTATAGLFDALTGDELKALSDAIITRRTDYPDRLTLGFGSNRVARMLSGTGHPLYQAYNSLAAEIAQLHDEVVTRHLMVIRSDV